MANTIGLYCIMLYIFSVSFFPLTLILYPHQRWFLLQSRAFLLSPRNVFHSKLSESVPQEEEGQKRIYQLCRHCVFSSRFSPNGMSLHRLNLLYNYSPTFPLNAWPCSWRVFSATDILQVFQPVSTQKYRKLFHLSKTQHKRNSNLSKIFHCDCSLNAHLTPINTRLNIFCA